MVLLVESDKGKLGGGGFGCGWWTLDLPPPSFPGGRRGHCGRMHGCSHTTEQFVFYCTELVCDSLGFQEGAVPAPVV